MVYNKYYSYNNLHIIIQDYVIVINISIKKTSLFVWVRYINIFKKISIKKFTILKGGFLWNKDIFIVHIAVFKYGL